MPTDQKTSDFPTLLRRRRLEAGLSQDALALRSGLSSDAIAALERGRRKRPRADTVTMLADGLGLRDAERTAFLSRALSAEQAAPAPDTAAAESSAPRRSLLTTLIGREAELARLLELLRSQSLVTLTGPGGMGKTRLALEVMDRVEGDASYVDLSAVRDSRLVAGVIGDHHGIGADASVDDLITHFRSRSLLLLLDNFEQVVDAAPLVARLLAGCSNLRLLVTSRIPLQIRSEQRFPLLGLPAPEGDECSTPDDAYPAVRLFMERALAVNPTLRQDAATLQTVGAICRRLDGLPLAIELAAARVRVLPPLSLLERLGRRLDVLTGGPRDLPDRQQTLRTTLDWSHELLTEDEQRLFASLGAFEGGASIDAIDRVCGGDQGDVVTDLEAILDKSLITQSEDSSSRARIGMLQTVLEYARERLDASPMATEIRRRHAKFFLALAEETRTGLTGPNQASVLVEIERELGNVRRALRWCIDEGEADLAIQLGAAVSRFCRMSSHVAEGRRWMDELIARFVDDQEPGWCDAPRASLLQETAAVANTQTDFEAAQKLGERALTCMRELGDELGEADTLNLLANAARNMGYLEDARINYAACLKIYEARQDRRGVSVVLNNLGLMAWIEGDLDAAAKYQDESLVIRRELADSSGIANLLSNMAEVAFERGRFAEAEEVGAESLMMRRKLGDVNGQALALDVLSITAQARGDLPLALSRHAECLDLAIHVANEGIIVTTARGLAVTLALEGRILDGARLLGAVEALDVCRAETLIDEVRFRRAWDQVRKLARQSAVGEASLEAARKVGLTFTIPRLIEEAQGLVAGDDAQPVHANGTSASKEVVRARP